jgi:beta-lactam-binding protein with PASTA domain
LTKGQAAAFVNETAKLQLQVATGPDRRDRGTVIAQTPDPGTRVAKGSEVAITVSEGWPHAPGINIFGGAPIKAEKRRLKLAGLKVARVVRKHDSWSSLYTPGKVFDSSPRCCHPVAPGTAVVLFVATSDACTPGYFPCLPPHLSRGQLLQYDCAGGSGDGPYFVSGPVRVTGDDPYGLDGDGNGVGCQ